MDIWANDLQESYDITCELFYHCFTIRNRQEA